MTRLPDPRRYAADAGGNRLATLALLCGAGRADARAALTAALTVCVGEGDDDAIGAALRAAPTPAAYRCLWNVLCVVVERAGGGVALGVRLFALPLVLVAGSREAATVPGVVPDIDEVTRLLEQHGAVGVTRNFGLGNALCAAETLERLKPGEVCRWSRDWSQQGNGLPFAPQALAVSPGREQAHLRFLIGAGITPRGAPSLTETAVNIGAWGLPLTRALARQLAQPGLSLLPVPRPPAGLLRAVHAGRHAQLELAFNLFVSNALRNFRAAIGEPTVVAYAYRSDAGDAEIRVSLSSTLDDTLLEGYRWPLHPFDDIDLIFSGMNDLLCECRVSDVRLLPVVVEAQGSGQGAFVTVRDFERHECAAAQN